MRFPPVKTKEDKETFILKLNHAKFLQSVAKQMPEVKIPKKDACTTAARIVLNKINITLKDFRADGELAIDSCGNYGLYFHHYFLDRPLKCHGLLKYIELYPIATGYLFSVMDAFVSSKSVYYDDASPRCAKIDDFTYLPTPRNDIEETLLDFAERLLYYVKNDDFDLAISFYDDIPSSFMYAGFDFNADYEPDNFNENEGTWEAFYPINDFFDWHEIRKVETFLSNCHGYCELLIEIENFAEPVKEEIPDPNQLALCLS